MLNNKLTKFLLSLSEKVVRKIDYLFNATYTGTRVLTVEITWEKLNSNLEFSACINITFDQTALLLIRPISTN